MSELHPSTLKAPASRWQRIYGLIFNYTTEALVLYTCLFFVFLPVALGTNHLVLLIAQKAAGLIFWSIYAGYGLWFLFKLCRRVVRKAKALRLQFAARTVKRLK